MCWSAVIHGWHDCVIRQEVLGWDDLDGYVESVKPYIDRAAAEDKVFSLCQHDWSSIREDPDMTATEAVIRYALEQGIQFMHYLDYYEMCKAEAAAKQSKPQCRTGSTFNRHCGRTVRMRPLAPTEIRVVPARGRIRVHLCVSASHPLSP